MNRIFDINEAGLITITPEALAIKPFRDVWERDHTPNKRRAWLELSACYFLTSYSSLNSYREYKEEEKIAEVFEDIFKGEDPLDTEDPIIIAAMKRMGEEDNKSIARRALRASIKATQKLETYLEEVNLLEEDDKGSMKHDPKKYQEVARNNHALAKSLMELEKEIIAEEEADGMRIRGDAEDEFAI